MTDPTPPPGYRGHWRPDRSQPELAGEPCARCRHTSRDATCDCPAHPDCPASCPCRPNAAPWPAGPNPNTYRVQVTLQVRAYSPDEAADAALEVVADAHSRNPNVTYVHGVVYPPQLAR